MDETYNDLYPVQLKDPEVPIQEDCTSDVVPEGTTNMEGKKKVLVPELITMTKYLFDNYRLSIHSTRPLRPPALTWSPYSVVKHSPLSSMGVSGKNEVYICFSQYRPVFRVMGCVTDRSRGYQKNSGKRASPQEMNRSP